MTDNTITKYIYTTQVTYDADFIICNNVTNFSSGYWKSITDGCGCIRQWFGRSNPLPKGKAEAWLECSYSYIITLNYKR